jgi:hypothetical protein
MTVTIDALDNRTTTLYGTFGQVTGTLETLLLEAEYKYDVYGNRI